VSERGVGGSSEKAFHSGAERVRLLFEVDKGGYSEPEKKHRQAAAALSHAIGIETVLNSSCFFF